MPDVPEAPVVKVMLGRDGQCIRVLIPDEYVGYRGFHDVMFFDRTDEDAPYVAVNDLLALRQQWPVLNLELEELRRMCKKKYCGAPTWLCTLCGKVIRLDKFRHVANYHLELAQLWRCPVSWCKGTPQDCIDHIRLVHSVPATVKAANLGRWFPPWTVTRDMSLSRPLFPGCRRMRSYSAGVPRPWYRVFGCFRAVAGFIMQ